MFFRNILDMIHTDLRWPLIIIFSIIIFINASGRIQIDGLFDATPQENINKFVNSVENINPDYTVDGEATGVYLYDQNRLTYNMMYGMGSKEYYVYVFTKNVSTDNLMNTAVEKILTAKSNPKVYGIATSDLIGTYDESYVDMAPVLLRLERDNSEKGSEPTVIVQNMYTLDDMSTLYKSLGLTEEVSGSSSIAKDTNTDSKKELNTDESDKPGGLLDSLFGKKESEKTNVTKDEKSNNEESNNEESNGFLDSIKSIFFKDGELR